MEFITPTTSPFVFTIRSTAVWCLDTHFRGRTMLCPPRNCPLCTLERPSRRGYAMVAELAGQADQTLGLIEIGADTLDQMVRVKHLDPAAALGTIWQFSRRADRHGWKVQRSSATQQPASAAETASANELLVTSLEQLYRLPFRINLEGEVVRPEQPAAWLAAHKEALTARMLHEANRFATWMTNHNPTSRSTDA